MRPCPGLLERGQRHVEVERAVDRAERQAGRGGGCFFREVHARAHAAVVRERHRQAVADRRVDVARQVPLHAEAVGERPVGLDDARFDLDLRLRHVERGQQARRALEALGQVVDDHRVGARVGLDGPALRQRRGREQRLQILGARVAERARHHPQLAGERLLVRQLAALALLVGQHGQRRDAHDGAVHRVAEAVGAQDDVERLIPRHVAQRDVDRALDGRVDDDVQAADLGEGPQHRAQVGAREVEADRVAGVARRVLRHALRGGSRLAASGLRGRRNRRRPRRRGGRRGRLLQRRGDGRRHGAGAAGDSGESNTTVSSLLSAEVSMRCAAARDSSIDTSVMSGEVGLRPTRTRCTGSLPAMTGLTTADDTLARFMTRRRGPSFGANTSAGTIGPVARSVTAVAPSRGCTRISLMVVDRPDGRHRARGGGVGVEPIRLDEDDVARAAHARTHRGRQRELHARDAGSVGSHRVLHRHGGKRVARVGLHRMRDRRRHHVAQFDDEGLGIGLRRHVGHRVGGLDGHARPCAHRDAR